MVDIVINIINIVTESTTKGSNKMTKQETMQNTIDDILNNDDNYKVAGELEDNDQGLINLGDYLSKALYELDAKEAKPLFKHKDK